MLAAVATVKLKTRTIDIGMAGNGAIAGLVAITAPSGYVEFWAAPIIGAVAGVIVVFGVYAIDKLHRRPGRRALGARPRRYLGHALVRAVHRPAPGPVQRLRRSRGRPLVHRARFDQLIAQAVGFAVAFSFVFAMSFATFWAIKKTIGLRVTEEEEDAGLDISEHGMYGYPEQFIPPEEYPGGAAGRRRPVPAPTPAARSRR